MPRQRSTGTEPVRGWAQTRGIPLPSRTVSALPASAAGPLAVQTFRRAAKRSASGHCQDPCQARTALQRGPRTAHPGMSGKGSRSTTSTNRSPRPGARTGTGGTSRLCRYRSIPVLVTRSALPRLDRAMRVFFSRVQSGKEPGFPRFRARNRYRSFSVDDPNATRSAIRIFDGSHRGEVRMRGLPRMRLAIRRALPPINRLRGFHVVRKARRVESCSSGSCRRSVPERLVGLDAGLRTFAMLSDGRRLERRPSSAVRSAIRRKRRAGSRSRRGSRSRGKKKAALARTHERAAEAGRHQLHCLTDRIVSACPKTDKSYTDQ